MLTTTTNPTLIKESGGIILCYSVVLEMTFHSILIKLKVRHCIVIVGKGYKPNARDTHRRV